MQKVVGCCGVLLSVEQLWSVGVLWDAVLQIVVGACGLLWSVVECC